MDHAAIRRLIQKRKIAISELLTQVEFEDVEQILMLLKRLRPADEVSVAMTYVLPKGLHCPTQALDGFQSVVSSR
jgi:hypothetical protein